MERVRLEQLVKLAQLVLLVLRVRLEQLVKPEQLVVLVLRVRLVLPVRRV